MTRLSGNLTIAVITNYKVTEAEIVCHKISVWDTRHFWAKSGLKTFDKDRNFVTNNFEILARS
mgnify:CR=1 FL=1